MDKLDTVLALLQEAIESSDWSKVEDAYNILSSHFEDPMGDYDFDGINDATDFDE